MYTVRVLWTSQPDPYGDGSIPEAGRTALIEGSANAIENYMADLQYGLDHSRAGVEQKTRYMNLAVKSRSNHLFLTAVDPRGL